MDPSNESSPRGTHNSDADVASSGYSSCDGSEFDRYCSANSAFGSASLCSSVGNRSDLLDSLKISKRWNGFDGLLDVNGVETPRENAKDSILMDGMSSSSKTRTGSKLFRSAVENSSSFEGKIGLDENFRCEDSEDEESGIDYYQDGILMDGIGSSSKIRDGSRFLRTLVEDSSFHKGKSTDNATEEERGLSDNSSCEHSEGGDSSIEYGSGDERRFRFVKRDGLQCCGEIVKESGNLFMNSLVAFGANDWDEFEQEGGGDGLGSMSLHENQLVQQRPSIDHGDGSLMVEKEFDEVPTLQKTHPEENSIEGLVKYTGVGREAPSGHSEEVSNCDAGETSVKQIEDESELTVTPLCNSIFEQSFNALNRACEGKGIGDEEIDETDSLLPMVGIVQNLALESIVGEVGKNLVAGEANKLETFDSYDETVLEMEEILLESGNYHGTRSTHADGGCATENSHHFRDGSSTASTSGADDAYPLPQYPPSINRVEVVGAKQKKGDVSFGERLVGVREYTIYTLRVWSDKDHWEVERRYRDFFALYHQLYTLFTDHGLSLPPPWSKVERESRKIFGNISPDVISERSILIQDCLLSILNSDYPFGTPSSLVSFLSPGQAIHTSSLLKSLIPQSLNKLRKDQHSKSLRLSSSKDVSMLGKTISLVVEIKPHKSMRQLLEAQHYTCAGCHRQLDAGKTLLREIVQTFGWNKPRFCEYTSQLFCGSCHTNDTIVLPAKVLHHWDFSLYPVSQFAKAFLESIYDQPMLCVSAVNPFLFSKVPALLHVMGIRKKIGAMIPYVRCPFRKAVQRSLGMRRYLLESNDFFALRDLVDLSKGLFAALPIMVDNISNKILEHITEQCLVCYDSGIPCAARQDCDDPTSLIFPFQEAEAAKCGSCGSILHKPCFVKLMGCCPCGKLKGGERRATTIPTELDRVSDRSIQASSSNLSAGFLSEILSKARPDKMWRPKNSTPVILMGSIPSNSL